jgi:hypothetical protein
MLVLIKLIYHHVLLTWVRWMAIKSLKNPLLKEQMVRCRGSTLLLVRHSAIYQIMLEFLGPTEQNFIYKMI